MAFSCVSQNVEVFSYNLSPTEWQSLIDDASHSTLRMLCCNAPAIAKTNEHGTQFFVHRTPHSDSCIETTTESDAHLHAKYLISKTLNEIGWKVNAERFSLGSNDIDLLSGIHASKGKAKMVAGVLWSHQPIEKTKQLNDFHKAAGRRCVWLLRPDGGRDFSTPIPRHDAMVADYEDQQSKELPIFSLVPCKDGILRVFGIHKYDGEYGFNEISLEISDFIEQLFTKKIQYVVSANNDGCWTLDVDEEDPVDYWYANEEDYDADEFYDEHGNFKDVSQWWKRGFYESELVYLSSVHRENKAWLDAIAAAEKAATLAGDNTPVDVHKILIQVLGRDPSDFDL